MNIFRSAITEADNQSVNVGYLSLFWILITVLNVIPIMVCGAVVQAYCDANHVFPYAELGKGVGLITGAFAAALAALGTFVVMDRKNQFAPLPQAAAAPLPLDDDDHHEPPRPVKDN